MTLTLAFYKGRGGWADWAVRQATNGRYSHVELIEGRADLGQEARCLSSSPRDGGVRERLVLLDPTHWDLVEMNTDPARAARYIRTRIGCGYDWTGILLSHVLAFGGHDKSRWFCSEIIAAALGLDQPNRISPQMLFDILTWQDH